MSPVFFDPSGKRWYRIVATMVVALAVAAWLLSWLLPQVTAPAWEQPWNQDRGYPQELLGGTAAHDVPVVGDDSSAAFARFGLVREVEGRTVLADPFSDRIFRELTEAERRTIGNSPYALEHFGRPADGELLLTLDDGPQSGITPAILDVLEKENVPATFFATGTNVVGNPDVYRRILAQGHMVGNHTTTHADSWDNGVRIREELIGTDRAMRAVGDYATPLFRAPEGDTELDPLAVLQAQQIGYLHVDADLDSRDWVRTESSDLAVPELDGQGHVVSLHIGETDGDVATAVSALKEVIAEAKADGYKFSTMAPLLPEEHQPVADTEPVLADEATALALTASAVVTQLLVIAIFWGWGAVMVTVSVLYIALGLIGHRRQKHRKWREVIEEELSLVSVVLPVFNEEPVVARTLAALRASDYPCLEVIAVDDGSTDRTLDILQEHAATWPELQVLTQLNGGKSMASNLGIMAAHGEIVVTLDGDTLFEPQTIRMLARHFNDHDGAQEVGIVAGHVKVGNRNNVVTLWQSLEYLCGICVGRLAESVAGAISIAPGACTAWRREALQRAGGYSHDTLAEDMDLTLAIREMGYAAVQDNQAVAWTEAPMTVRSLAKQRLRWTYGYLQALRKYSGMILRPRHGVLGMVALPYGVLATFLPMLYLPLILLIAGSKLVTGNWANLAGFVFVGVVVHTVTCVLAIRMAGERPLHLWVVPVYLVIYVPFRIYVLYAALVQALQGRLVGWYKPERTNSVRDLSPVGETTAHLEPVHAQTPVSRTARAEQPLAVGNGWV